MHSLVDSCVCPDWGSNLQPWQIATTFPSAELPSPGLGILDTFQLTVICHGLKNMATIISLVKAFEQSRNVCSGINIKTIW